MFFPSNRRPIHSTSLGLVIRQRHCFRGFRPRLIALDLFKVPGKYLIGCTQVSGATRRESGFKIRTVGLVTAPFSLLTSPLKTLGVHRCTPVSSYQTCERGLPLFLSFLFRCHSILLSNSLDLFRQRCWRSACSFSCIESQHYLVKRKVIINDEKNEIHRKYLDHYASSSCGFDSGQLIKECGSAAPQAGETMVFHFFRFTFKLK